MSSKKEKASVGPARLAAHAILRRVEEEGAYAAALLAAQPEAGLSAEDRGLAHELVLGVLRWQSALDYLIDRQSHRQAASLDASVRIALRLGVYQLRYLTRVPAAAAVNESVNLVKRRGAGSAAGFVNAVLRGVASDPDRAPGDGISDLWERLAVEVSHPSWMLKRWAASLGLAAARDLAVANNRQPGVAFRVNTLQASEAEALASLETEGVESRPSSVAPGAFVVERGAGLAATRAARTGLIYIQTEASQLVAPLVAPEAGHRVLDLCAAPGSKSSHLAALGSNEAWVMACDLYAHRLATLKRTCNRLGARSVDAVALDARLGLPVVASAPRFDRALVDAPCSGTGTLGQNPEIKWRLEPDAIARLAELQLQLLQVAGAAVAPGGRLVYSTCSLEPEENELVVHRFLESGGPFRLARPAAPSEVISSEGFVKTFPHLHGTEGFFAAVIERSS